MSDVLVLDVLESNDVDELEVDDGGDGSDVAIVGWIDVRDY